ncbi:AT-rich interactive domain-containing protein 5B [Heptranchias perlo]|uniref:AT-rich interactive domain-containing protein 5B n=1 Tax=Heptranchias perlo TaxID=212740 RepID=UPI00355A8042
METDSIKWVGSPCGLHGAYIFYKAFKFSLEGRPRILSLGDFFFVRCKPGAPICIAELQLLWEERNNNQLLSSSKLYFLPEDTPEGRSIGHGEDEVVAVLEKVVVKLDDLMKWACSDFSTWTRGLGAVSLKPSKRKELGMNGQKEALHHYRQCTLNSGLNFKDVLKEKTDLGADDDNDGDDVDDTKIIVLSYPQYCRYRTMLKRIQNRSSSWLADQFVMALGGIAILNESTRILYCRDTFDHPTLIENKSVCDEFAPNLKGRPRKKKPFSQKRDTQALNGLRDSNEDSDGKGSAKSKCEPKTTMAKPKNNSNCKNIATDEKSKVAAGDECRAEEQAFLVTLYKYMKERNTPIERIPYLGFKQINLWTMFQAAQNLGGYEAITARRQWKQIYDELGGNPGSTSAATCTRRHYERLILPYERYIKGEEDKPLPPVKPRKQETSPQESESKMRAAGTKRKNEQNRKVKKERDPTQKVKDSSEAISAVEGSRETDDSRDASASAQEGEVKLSQSGAEGQHCCVLAEGSDGKGGQTKDKVSKGNSEQSKGKVAEQLYLHQGLTAYSGDVMTQSPVEGQPLAESKAISTTRQELESPERPTDALAKDFQEKAASEVTAAEKCAQPSTQRDAEDRGLSEASEDIVNGSIQVDQSPKEEVENRLGSNRPQSAQRQQQGQATRVSLNLSPGPHKEKEELFVATKNEACPSYMPLVYSRGHPGIMSPLAKKKFLSQVSGTLPNNYLAPLLSSKKFGDNGEEMMTTESNFLQGSTSDQLAINRPSVIQHAHSFQKRNTDERGEAFKHDGLNKLSDSEAAYLSKHHLNCTDSFKGGAPYPFTSDLLDNENKSSEKKGCQPSQVSSFLADFYSSPHLHSLYRHTEHHLNNDQTSKYLSSITKDKSSLFVQHKNQDKVYLNYLSTLHQPEKKCAVKPPTEDQPTDLSLPKLKKTSPKNLANNALHLSSQLDSKSTTASTQPAHSDCNPKACRVPPMPIPTNTKSCEAIPPPSAKLEDVVRPTMSAKGVSQVVGTTKPVKRNRDGADNPSSESPEKKLRAVSPMLLSKDMAMKETPSDSEAESSKTLPSGIFLEGHKFPLPTPIFPGVYPGTFVSQVQDMCDGLGSRFPVDYAHPLQYLKNQAVLSPLMQPLAIHSFMIPAMQRQILASTSASPQLYRHLSAAATPVAASYGDILHHGLYPLAALNPQVAYSTMPISSPHPSTKL